MSLGIRLIDVPAETTSDWGMLWQPATVLYLLQIVDVGGRRFGVRAKNREHSHVGFAPEPDKAGKGKGFCSEFVDVLEHIDSKEVYFLCQGMVDRTKVLSYPALHQFFELWLKDAKVLPVTAVTKMGGVVEQKGQRIGGLLDLVRRVY